MDERGVLKDTKIEDNLVITGEASGEAPVPKW